MKPVTEYVRHYNESHIADVEQYKAERQFLERQKQAAMNGKSANLSRVKELTDELCKLKEVHELRLTAADVTPEALAVEMLKQGGRMAVMDDEGSIFDIVSGIYNGGQANINLLLKSYDGSPHTILRRTSENITLENPLLSMGILTQPQQFRQAMSNPQFSGRGLIQRFVFSFAKGKAGSLSFTSDNIPQSIQKRYNELIIQLLKLPFGDKPKTLTHDKESYAVFRDYFEMLQKKMQTGGIFENMKDYASKHFGKVLRIAGLLHLCEHTADEPINGQTALNAVSIGLWAENQALLAFDGGAGDSEVIKNAKYIVSRLKSSDSEVLTRRELKHLCRSIHNDNDFDKPLELLEEMHYLRKEINSNTGGRPSEKYIINPLV